MLGTETFEPGAVKTFTDIEATVPLRSKERSTLLAGRTVPETFTSAPIALPTTGANVPEPRFSLMIP